jgi:hypothetical protein
MESKMEKTLVEKTKRTRVHGTGPRRNKLVLFKKLGDVSEETISELNDILDTHAQRNDLGDYLYAISKTTNFHEALGVPSLDKYRQILLQRDPNSTEFIDKVDESVYTDWATWEFELKSTMADMERFYDKHYRFRAVEMSGSEEIGWHIDTDTSVGCRGQVCLNDNDSVMEFKDRSGVHSLHMKRGEVWFINTGWPHRVLSGEKTRRNAILTCDFHDMKQKDIFYV